MNIYDFLTCPRCHCMHEDRATKCEACGFEHPQAAVVDDDDTAAPEQADLFVSVSTEDNQ